MCTVSWRTTLLSPGSEQETRLSARYSNTCARIIALNPKENDHAMAAGF